MRKHTPRKYIDPMGWIAKRTPLADDQQRDLGIAYRISLQAILNGHGTEQAWATLCCTLNVALILCEIGIHAHALQSIKLAQETMVRVRERAQRTGKWAFDGDGIRAIHVAVNLHDEQITRASRGQITAAIVEVQKRVEVGETV